jgi:hypothetical protein
MGTQPETADTDKGNLQCLFDSLLLGAKVRCYRVEPQWIGARPPQYLARNVLVCSQLGDRPSAIDFEQLHYRFFWLALAFAMTAAGVWAIESRPAIAR